MSMEMPLVIFTVLSQASIGIALMSAVRRVTAPDTGTQPRREWWTITLLMGVGILGSLFHLGHPLEAYRALAHLDGAWLSREILVAGIFIALAGFAALIADRQVPSALAVGCAVAGVALVFISGMTYAPPALPAVNNALPTAFFGLSTISLGAAFGSWFVRDSSRPMLARILTATLVAALVLGLTIPCVWLSGGEIMRRTGIAWMQSPLYWGHIAVTAAALVITLRNRDIPRWLAPLLLLGELVGRAGFFADTIHTASNMGGLY